MGTRAVDEGGNQHGVMVGGLAEVVALVAAVILGPPGVSAFGAATSANQSCGSIPKPHEDAL